MDAVDAKSAERMCWEPAELKIAAYSTAIDMSRPMV